MNTGLIPNHPTFENYGRAWREAHISTYFFNTLFVTVGSVVITTISAALMGYVLGRRPLPGKSAAVRADAVHPVHPAGLHHHPGVRTADRSSASASRSGG